MKRLRTFFFLSLMNLPMNGWRRAVFARLAGVDVSGKGQYIGRNVCFDSIAPERIHIGDNVHITAGTTFLTHYHDTASSGVSWKYGDIHVGDGVFIGMNTIVTKPCTIGKDAIIGAGSVVTKDIPSGEIWGGNPAKFIKKRVG